MISELDKAKKEASYLQVKLYSFDWQLILFKNLKDQLSKMSYDPKVEENLIKERDLQETIVSDIQHVNKRSRQIFNAVCIAP